MWLARGLWFFQDEWDFLLHRDLTSLNDLLRPHNEHWSTIPIVIYRALFSVFGIDTYLPYLGVLVLANVAIGYVVAELLRRNGAPSLIAILAGLLFILFGPGVQNIAWAFQIGFVLSLLCFLLAVLVVSRARRQDDWLANALLLGSLMSSGLGPSFVLAMTFGLLVRGERKRTLRVVLLPLVLYGVWFTTSDQHVPGHTLVSSAQLLPRYVARGLSDALQSLFGLGLSVGGTLLILIAILLIVGVASKRAWPPPLAAATTTMAVVLVFVSAGLVRAARFGVEQAGVSRYTHIAAPLLLVGVGTGLFASRLVPKPLLARTVVIIVLMLTPMVFDSSVTLGAAIHNQTPLRDEQRTAVAAVLEILASDEQPDLVNAATPVFRAPAMTVERMRMLVADGTLHPLPDVEVQSQVRLEVLRRMQFAWLRGRPSSPPLMWQIADLISVSVQQLDSDCLTVQVEDDDPRLLLQLGGSGALEVRSDLGGTIKAYLGTEGGFRETAMQSVNAAPGQTLWLQVADTGERPQELRIDPPGGDVMRVCSQ